MSGGGRSSAGLLSFVDMMLCAVGCGLMLLAVYLGQAPAAGRGWDQRPLVVVVSAAGPPDSYPELRARWSVRPAWRPPDDDPAVTGATAVPASRETGNGERAVFVVPEAEFGRWAVAVTLTAARRPGDDLFRAIESSGLHRVDRPGDRDVVARYAGLYRRFLDVRGAGEPPPEAARLAADLRAAVGGENPIRPTVTGMSGETGRPVNDAGLYVRARVWAMLATLEARDARTPGGRPALAELAGATSPRSRVDSYNTEADEVLRLAVRGEYEAIAGADPAAWGKLDRLLAACPGAGERGSACYAAWRSEMVRVRSALERGARYAPPLGGGDGLAGLARAGPGDLACELVAAEVMQFARRPPPVRVRARVAWGDTPAAASPGGPDVDDAGGVLVEVLGASGAEHGLFTILLEQGRPPRAAPPAP